jgi:NAD(P)-dependent dehydrogenase (short-subunit alcohol dehydrogenase family)
VLTFTRHLAVDYGQAGIRCNCVWPGWIDTGLNQSIFTAMGMTDAEVATLVQQTVPMNRQEGPGEVAAAIAFRCSDDASYVSGPALVVDRGQMAP